jgi:hypothetical protein
MPDCPLDVDNDLAGFGLIPAPIEVLGRKPELHDKIAREILRLYLAAFLLPEPQQGVFIVPHNYSCIRAADEPAPIDKFGQPIHDTPPAVSAPTNDCVYGSVDAVRRAFVVSTRIGLHK